MLPALAPPAARARLLRCLTARLAALGSSTLPGDGGVSGPLNAQALPRLLAPAASQGVQFGCVWHQVGGALRDAWRGWKSGMEEMKSGMDGELQIARFAELQDELELLGIPQERA